MSYSWTKYVPIHQAEEYRNLGWELKDAGHPHNQWSFIGVWKSLRDDPPPVPVLRRDAEEHKAMQRTG